MNPTDPTDLIIDPYDDWVDTYRSRGWTGTLPLTYGRKTAPPAGFTGGDGRMPETTDIDRWRREGPSNIALRLPRNIIGIDVDDYAAKAGRATFLACIKRAGRLPATWTTTSRPESPVSGIRWFRLPTGYTSDAFRDPEHVGPDVEIVRYGHRYAVVPPSIHPDGGTYTWVRPDGTDTADMPSTGDLPELPLSWCDLLQGVQESASRVSATTHDVFIPTGVREVGTPITTKHDDTLAAYAASVVAKYSAHVPLDALVAMVVGRGQDCVPSWNSGLKHGEETLERRARHVWLPSALQKFGHPYQETETAALGAGGILASRINWHQLLGEDMPEEEWILEPLISCGRQIVIYSPPKVGKSLLALELAAGIASGRPVVGSGPIKARTVLYLDYENAPADIRDRAIQMHLNAEDLDRLVYMSFPALSKLDTVAGGAEVLRLAQDAGAEVVIIDTATRTIQGEENSNDTWAAWYANTGLKLKRAGIALIRLDHTGKDDLRGQRGGSSKSSDVDAVWRLTKLEGDVLHLKCDISRTVSSEDLLVLHRRDMPLRHEVDAQGRPGSLSSRVEAIIALLNKNHVSTTLGIKATVAAIHGLGSPCSEPVAKRAQIQRREVTFG